MTRAIKLIRINDTVKGCIVKKEDETEDGFLKRVENERKNLVKVEEFTTMKRARWSIQTIRRREENET